MCKVNSDRLVYKIEHFLQFEGFGEDNLRSLAGKVGQQDVFDVQCAAEVTAQREEINPTKIVIFGGSHGGFLASHAIGMQSNFALLIIIITIHPYYQSILLFILIVFHFIVPFFLFRTIS